MGKFWGLFVGINKYQRSNLRNLKGCVRDIQDFSAYLFRKQTGTELPEPVENQTQAGGYKRRYVGENVDFLLLSDAFGTRANILQAFQAQFGQAKAGDQILFYFSGHGCQEKLGQEMQHLKDLRGKFDAFYCHDSQAETLPILGIEIRYLLHHMSKIGVGIQVISDSCHAEHGTRAAGGSKQIILKKAFKGLMGVLRPRKLEEFLFMSPEAESLGLPRLSLEAFQHTDQSQTVIPHAQHVHLAAAASEQFAYEIGEKGQEKDQEILKGAFTASLIEHLDSFSTHGDYDVLIDDIRHHLKSVGLRQTPQWYHHSKSVSTRTITPSPLPVFPGQHPIDAPNTPIIRYLNGRWILNRGASHGLRPATTHRNVRIGIIDPFSENELAYVTHLDIQDRETFFTLPPSFKEFQNRRLKARIHGLQPDPLWLLFDPTQDKATFLQAAITAHQATWDALNIDFTDQPERAHYRLNLRDDQFQLSTVGDADTPPRQVIRPYANRNASTAERFIKALQKIARWHALRKLHAPDPKGGPADGTSTEFHFQGVQAFSRADEDWTA
ncbi:MAG: caspase family protein, partial [Bacteroidota bacterium]